MTHLKRIMRDVTNWIKIVKANFLLTVGLLLALELGRYELHSMLEII